MAENFTRPKNTTKRTGIGCGVIAVFLFAFAALAVALGFAFDFDANYFIAGGTLFTFGLLGGIAGIGLFIKGKQVDKMLSGADLIAAWDYLIDENGERRKGYIYVGSKGFYKNGLYTAWSRTCQPMAVVFQPGTPAKLVFQYRMAMSHQGGGGSSTHNTFVAVPPDRHEEAMRVVDYHKKRLSKSKK